MFELFTPQARAAVVRAQSEARSLGHAWTGPEHLLLGLAAQPDAPAALRRLGVTHTACRAAVRAAADRGDGVLDAEDAAALRTLGIDLGVVRGRAEAAFGPGALDAPSARAPRRPAWPRRRRRAGAAPFTRPARQALERSQREAAGRWGVGVETAHVLLGVLRHGDAVTAGALRRLGTDARAVRAGVLADLGRAVD
ncbi:Clp protease N-terminal domain-containing protein [Streptomyces sp. NPDC003077]|uniref:Clp protease N-terminal domain-containing protein n=1 Tax=Streptomyces sp. NPDC003077 TaxID=3154443 RepID=UPI0033B478B0